MCYNDRFDDEYYDDECTRYYDHIYPETTIVFKGTINFTEAQKECLKNIVEDSICENLSGVDDFDDSDISDVSYEATIEDGDTYFSYSCTMYVRTFDTYTVKRYDEYHSEVHASEHFVEIDDPNDANFDNVGYDKSIHAGIEDAVNKGKLPTNLEIIDIDRPYISIDWSEVE